MVLCLKYQPEAAVSRVASDTSPALISGWLGVGFKAAFAASTSLTIATEARSFVVARPDWTATEFGAAVLVSSEPQPEKTARAIMPVTNARIFSFTHVTLIETSGEVKPTW